MSFDTKLTCTDLTGIFLLPTGDTCCMVTVVLLCLSVIGIPLVIAVWYFNNAEKGKHGTN